MSSLRGDVSLSMEGGEARRREHTAPRLTVSLNSSGEEGGHGIVLRCESVRIVRPNGISLFLPSTIECASLTLALKLRGKLTFSHCDGKWTCMAKEVDVKSLKSSFRQDQQNIWTNL